MKIFRNATVYKTEMPPIEQLQAALEQLPYEPIGEATETRASFVPNAITAELVTPLADGYTFTMRYDAKVLPSSIVNAAAAEAINLEQEQRGCPLTRAERVQIKDSVRAELVKKALVMTTTLNVFYNSKHKYLILPTTNGELSRTLEGILRSCFEDLKMVPFYLPNLKGSLTGRLRQYFTYGEDEAFGQFDLAGYCQLKSGSDKASFDLQNLTSAREGVSEALQNMMEVESMALSYGEVSFKLTHSSQLRLIGFNGELTEDEQAERDELDTPALYRMEASVQMLLLGDTLDVLAATFTPDENDEAGEA
jgi:recombination associated protein RdgC